MNFHLSDEQAALQDTVRRYARDTLEGGLRRQVFESGTDFDPGFWRGLMELGIGGICVGEAYGGLGLGLVDLALVAEVLGEEAAPGPFLGHALATLAMQAGGSPEQRERWLPRLASGEAIGSIALAEDGERWGPGEWTLDLVRGRVTGHKTAVPGAGSADVLVVGLRGGGLALVEPREGTAASSMLDGADRTRRIGNVRFESAAAQPLGEAGSGRELFAQLGVLLAADAFGGATRCLRMTAGYAGTRVQFGVPVGSFQGMKHRLADLACAIEPARGLWWYAALAQDLHKPDRLRLASLAKAHLADGYNKATRTAVELHGGIGFTWEYDLQLWVKRAMFDFAFGGTPTRHRRWAMLDT